MEKTKEMLEKARRLFEAGKFDKEAYERLQDYVLKNGSRLQKDSDFQALRGKVEEIARKHHLPTLESLQEHFGLNSCAQ